jgi:hypothetical protein
LLFHPLDGSIFNLIDNHLGSLLSSNFLSLFSLIFFF